MDKKTLLFSLLFLAPAALLGSVALVCVSGAESLALAGKLPNMANELAGTWTLLAWVLVGSLAAALGLAVWLGSAVARRTALLAAPLRLAAQAGLAAGASSPESYTIENYAAELNAIFAQTQQLRQELKNETQRAETKTSLAAEALSQAALARERAEASRCQGLLSAANTLGGAISSISDKATALHKAAAHATGGAEEQRRASSEAASAMEQMNASVTQVAGSAETAAAHADAATRRARAGAEAVERTVAAITQAHERTTALGEVISNLGSQAGAIGKVMEIISDIADQTNLLALNAAIEAARAGDAGRGFAVVADEVRKLAEKTMSATRDVGDQIKGIQDGVAGAHAGMDQAARLVDQATELARQSGDTLRSIVELAQENSAQVQSIAAAAVQQSAASEQITRTISAVDEISGRTGQDMETSMLAVSGLMEHVEELVHLNNVFTLIGNGPVQALIGRLAASPEVRSLDPGRIESALRKAARENDFIELLYLTDERGRQPIANIAAPGRESSDDAKARGRDWSSRPWFRSAKETQNLVISDIYISQATGEPCITVSTPFWDGAGKFLGVLAADVSVRG
jgi:methyl-accepting chemotaxis protein